MDVNSNDGETRKCYTSEHITSHHITSLAFKGIDIVSDFMILKNDFVQTTLRRAPPTSYDKNTNTLKNTKNNKDTNLNMIIHSLDRATVRRAPPTSYSVSNHLRDLAQVELI